MGARVLTGLARASKKRVKFVTLTTRTGLSAGEVITLDGTRQHVRDIRAAFRKLWYEYSAGLSDARPWAEIPGVGAVCKVELGAEGMVHIHALISGVNYIRNDSSSNYALSEAWRALTGASRVWVEDCEIWGKRHGKSAGKGLVGAVKEVSKYVSKPGHNAAAAALAPFAAVALYRQRRWDTYGALRGVDLSGEEHWESCEECGSSMWVSGEWAINAEQAEASLDAILLLHEYSCNSPPVVDTS